MEMEVLRPLLTLHVFGSKGCGKTSLKKQWFDSSHSRVISEIADVHIRIQVSVCVGGGVGGGWVCVCSLMHLRVQRWHS